MAAIVARRVCKRAAVRTIFADIIRAVASACSAKTASDLAGARERVGKRRGQSPRPHAASPWEIGFAPEMIGGDHAAHFHSRTEEAGMTAYLISLALVGLVAIALSEGFS